MHAARTGAHAGGPHTPGKEGCTDVVIAADTATITLLAALFILAGVGVSKISDRVGIPALLLFLLLGMLAGSDGIGGIYFDDAEAAASIGIVALGLILFSGGLDTEWSDVRQVMTPAGTMATLGVLVTAVTLGLLGRLLLGIPLAAALMLGSIVSSTDAAAVFAVLRSKSISLRGVLRPLLETESGSNDPMALFLTTVAIGLASPTPPGVAQTLLRFLWQFALGGALGYLAGRAYPFVMSRVQLGYEGLYPVLSLGLVMATYGACSLAGGNGFLALYVAGIIANRTDFFHRRSIARFHAGLAWLMQITMFTMLGLFVFPSRLPGVAGVGLAVAALLIFVARPVSVLLSTLPFRLRWRERVFLSWVGLRGAAPIILATFPRLAGVENADLLFHLVFFVVLVSTTVQGTTIALVARWLGVDAPLLEGRPYPLEYNPVPGMRGRLTEFAVPNGSGAVGRTVMNLRLPQDVLVLLIARGDGFVIPRGATVVEPGDRLLVLGEEPSLEEARRRLGAPGEEPGQPA